MQLHSYGLPIANQIAYDFLINTLTMSKIKEMGGKVIPTLLEMVPAEEPENKTVIEYLNLEFDIDINENFFSLQNTKRVR